ncbi:MAG TPA: PIG-L family deacetylase [Acidobacteriota bacterium]
MSNRSTTAGREAAAIAALRPKALLCLGFFLFLCSDVRSQQETASRQRQALKDLATSFSMMSVAAHPDDEDAEALTMMRMKWGVRASVVVSNYGEGGQNAIGPELYEDLGALRYSELRAAASGYSVSRVLSLGFVDFGFSKTAEETFQFWGGKQEVVDRLVAAIRSERPMVIITNHSAEPRRNSQNQENQEHGNHRAVAIALKDAFRLAAQPGYRPDLGVAWKTLRLFQAQQQTKEAAVVLHVGEVEPLTGRTYSEIARSAYLQHASQGPWQIPYIRPRDRYYKLWDSASPENLSGADNFFTGLEQPFLPEIGMNLRIIQKRFQNLADTHVLPDASPALRQIQQDQRELERLRRGLAGQFSGEKREKIRSSIEEVAGRLRAAKGEIAGLRVTWDLTPVSEEAASKVKTGGEVDRLFHSRPVNEAVAGDWAVFRLGIASPLALKLNLAKAQWPKGWSETGTIEGPSAASVWTIYGVARVSSDADVTEPFRYFYKKEHLPQISWRLDFSDGPVEIPFEWTVSPRVFPRLEISVSPDHWLVWQEMKTTATVRLTNHTMETLEGTLSGAGAAAQNARVQVAPNRTQTVHWPLAFRSGNATNEVIRFEGADGTRASAEVRERPGDLRLGRTGKIGLLRHTDSSTEEALKNLGVSYQIITRDQLLSGDLSQYQTILVDHRAYVLIPELVENNERLLNYARNGGNLVVFYQRAGEFNTENGFPQLAPYPLHVSSKRVTVEEAPVRILLPEHALLHRPNTIAPSDFEGWVQERGLYFPDKWDSRYQALLSTNDPGEGPLSGGLLAASVGKGTYVYTSYVWYRQWKELNNGAFRMLANLLSFGNGE